MYEVRGYWAAILVFREEAEDATALKKLLESKKTLLKVGGITVVSGGVMHTAEEVCYDVYDKTSGVWHKDLSRAFKK